MPRALQAIGWMQRPLAFMERCQRRYGDIFTLRILHWGDWVLLCDPEDVKAVFTAGDKVGVDVANPMLEPVLGPRSVMLLEEPEHMRRRKLMLPPFHRQSVEADDEMIAEVARREVGRWPVGEPFQLWPRMQAITQEVVMRAVFGADEDERLGRLRELLRRLTVWMNSPRNLALLATFGPRWVVRSRQFREAMRPVEAAVLDEVKRRRADGDLREDVVSMLVPARYEDGSPL
ncbi:MAG: cytochrome P450, partial [Solirubrobacterales bacterium]